MAAEGEHISAAELLARAVASNGGDDWKARSSLRRLAKEGQIQARGLVEGETETSAVPPLFWTNWTNDDGQLGAYEDWTRGSFTGQSRTGKLARISQVAFARETVDSLFPPVVAETRPSAKRPPRGRPRADWVPYAVAELVNYLDAEGQPRGHQTQGAEKIIDTILQRLSDRGLEGSRSTLQPIVNQVLKERRAPSR